MKFTEKYFFHHYNVDTAIKASLSEESGLVSHGDILVISQDHSQQWIERRFVWSHIGSRPWGTNVPQQCPRCKRMRPWDKPKMIKQRTMKTCAKDRLLRSDSAVAGGPDFIKHSCRFCRYSKTFAKPDNFVRDGVMAESGRGEWYFTRRVLPQKC